MELKNTQRKDLANYLQTFLNSKQKLVQKLLLGVFVFSYIFTPLSANASVFSRLSSLFSSEAKADTINNTENSQTKDVLEAKISVLPNEKISYSDNILSSDTVLIPEVGTLGTPLDIEDYPQEDQINIYTVKKGDTLAGIAKMYNISTNTIIWANDKIDPKKALKEGTELLIMPISGVSHSVAKNDTLNKIAKKYNADAKEIALFNGITDESLVTGEVIIIPNGEIYVPKKTTTIAKTSTAGASKLISGYSGSNQGNYYRKPVLNCIKTQGLHGKNAVDLGCKIGTQVFAAADGVVIAARMGWNGGYGNMIILSHPNGTQTVYGHLSKVNVSSGQTVSDGEVIGATGNSGQSTGPHIHFEIRGARNCYVDNSCR